MALKVSNKNRKAVQKIEEAVISTESRLEDTLTDIQEIADKFYVCKFHPTPRGYWIFVGILLLIGIFIF
jgi:hypothetical protein